MAPRGPKNLRICFTAEGLTHFGGLVLVQRFLQRLGLRRALTTYVWFPQRNHHYSIAEHVLAVLYPLILGLGRLETTEPLRRNGVFQYLAGLPSYPAMFLSMASVLATAGLVFALRQPRAPRVALPSVRIAPPTANGHAAGADRGSKAPRHAEGRERPARAAR